MKAILSLDIGTTVIKAVLFDLSGNELSVAECGCGVKTPHKGWVEQDPEEVWEAVLTVLSIIEKKQNSSLQIIAIGLATQGGSMIPVDGDGNPVYPFITWMDSRANEIVKKWKQNGIAERIRNISGWTPEAGLPISMIEWLRENRSDVFGAAHYWLSVNDFILFRLTGEYCTNPSMAGEMLLTDISLSEWSDELCNIVGINSSQLSPIKPSTEKVGCLAAEVCQRTGLASDIIVINGGQDHTCEALAVGMTRVGRALLACGTAWVINGVSNSSSMDNIPEKMNLNYHVQANQWVISQFLGGLGAYVEWWLRQAWQNDEADFGKNRSKLYESFNRELAPTTAGGEGLIAFPLTGWRQLSDACQGGGFWGLRLDHTRADMGRAILESIAYELRWALEKLADAGMIVEDLWMIGGAAKSPFWPQIIADVNNVNIFLSQYSHGPALGVANLAGVGMGVFTDFDEGRKIFEMPSRKVIPEEKKLELYDQSFNLYKQLGENITSFFSEQDDVAR